MMLLVVLVEAERYLSRPHARLRRRRVLDAWAKRIDGPPLVPCIFLGIRLLGNREDATNILKIFLECVPSAIRRTAWVEVYGWRGGGGRGWGGAVVEVG